MFQRKLLKTLLYLTC